MSGKIGGTGGLGEIFKRIRTPVDNSVESSAQENQPKTQGDRYVSSSVAQQATLTDLTQALGAVGPSASSLVKGSKDLNDFIQKMVKNDFPNLKLTPVQSAGLMTYIRDQLALTGMTDQNFHKLQDHLE